MLLTQENTQIKELQQENKGKKKKHSILLIVWLVMFIFANPLHDCLCRTLVVSRRAPVRARVDHGSIPQADAPADDGEEGAGHQTCAEPA